MTRIQPSSREFITHPRHIEMSKLSSILFENGSKCFDSSLSALIDRSGLVFKYQHVDLQRDSRTCVSARKSLPMETELPIGVLYCAFLLFPRSSSIREGFALLISSFLESGYSKINFLREYRSSKNFSSVSEMAERHDIGAVLCTARQLVLEIQNLIDTSK